MEIQHLFRSRRTIHRFNRDIVALDIIERAIDAANQAPCHKLTFPWRFTEIGTQKREELAKQAIILKYKDTFTDKKDKEEVRSKIMDPSHLIVVSQIFTDNQIQKKEDYAACACAIQNLSLSLAADGVGSKWSTGKIISHINTYKIIEIDPMHEEIIGFIWIGYGEIPSQVKRPSLTSVFRKA
tara:strand:- start:594 stop:1142 length:549 start_codon:yes stop_codon:yes gene_type:complete